MSLTSVIQRVAAQLPTTYPHVYGPPFRVPPAAPCYVVEMPSVRGVAGVAAGCEVTDAAIDVVCIPQTGSDHDALVEMADELIAAFGEQITGGQPEPNPYADVDDVWTYRLTLEV